MDARLKGAGGLAALKAPRRGATFLLMSTHCTTNIIDRRSEGREQLLARYYRHHDGSPLRHGAQLIELLLEIEPCKPEQLVDAIDSRWSEPWEIGSASDVPTPHLERTDVPAHKDGSHYRYDVIYERAGSHTACRVECYDRLWKHGDSAEDFRTAVSQEWALLAQRLAEAVVFWIPFDPAPPGPRQRLSGLSVGAF